MEREDNNDVKSKGDIMKRKIVGVILAIILIVVMGAVALSGFIMHRNAESEEPLNYEATYEISGNQIGRAHV